MLKQDVRNRLALIGVAAAVAVLALLFGWTAPAASVHAQGAGGAMSIAISGVDCNGGTCDLDPGDAFTLTVSVDEAPTAGYIGVGTQVVYQSLIYTPTADKEDEMLINTDGFPGVSVRAYPGTPGYNGPAGAVNHAQTAGTPPSFTTSHYTGPVVTIALACTDVYSHNEVKLAPYAAANTLGSGFKLPLASGGTNVPAAGQTIVVNCGVAPTGTPAPTPPGLPGTGTGTTGGGSDTGLWIAIASLLVLGAAAGAGALAWRRASN